MGQTRNAAKAARRPALRQRLSVRRIVQPGASEQRGAALRRPHDEAHLDEISRNVAVGAHAVLLLDRAGWHTTGKLDVPNDVTPIFLPSRAPELNPVENVGSISARTGSQTPSSKTTTPSSTPHAMHGELTADPNRIKSIGMRDWPHVGQPL